MKTMKSLFALAALVLISGCASTVAPGEDGSGTYSWTQRELRGEFSGSLLDVAEAAQRAFADLRLVGVNQVVDGLKGKVTAIKRGAVAASVKVDIGGGNVITSTVTVEAVDDLALSEGSDVTVVIKASEVLLATGD